MFSALAIKTSGSNVKNIYKVFVLSQQRCSASTAVASHAGAAVKGGHHQERVLWPNEDEYPTSGPLPITVEQKINNWKKANEIFFGPQRDLKKFPHPEYMVHPEEYQFGFIPTRWFKALYPKLGVTGGYTLLWGTLLAMTSKEILVFDEVPAWIFGFWGLFTFHYLMFRDKMNATTEKAMKESRRWMYEEPLHNAKSSYEEEINIHETEIARQNAIPTIYNAKQELVDLQLELQYRQRVANVYRAVKQRLDYQASMDDVKRRFEQDHMVRWIVENVKKSITPQQEKDSLISCINTLKQLSKTASVKL